MVSTAHTATARLAAEWFRWYLGSDGAGKGIEDSAEFVYVTYINTTPEKVWNALMDDEIIKQYWAVTRMSPTGESAPLGYIKTMTPARSTLTGRLSSLIRTS